MTIRDILTSIRERLQKQELKILNMKAGVLLEWKLHIDRAEFYMNPNGEVKQELLEELEEVLLKENREFLYNISWVNVSLWDLISVLMREF